MVHPDIKYIIIITIVQRKCVMMMGSRTPSQTVTQRPKTRWY